MPIEFKKINFAYKEKQVLRNVNFVVENGEKVALVGASGSGKTTLMNILTGILRPDSGEVCGVPKDGVSMVFQEDRLLKHMTVEDNIALVSKLSHNEILDLLDEVGLKDEAGNYPDNLSGGMMRRVAIVRSIAYEKELYIMDEPFKGLDAKTKEQAAQFVLKHTIGKTLIVITHDSEDIELLGARVVDINSINEC